MMTKKTTIAKTKDLLVKRRYSLARDIIVNLSLRQVLKRVDKKYDLVDYIIVSENKKLIECLMTKFPAMMKNRAVLHYYSSRNMVKGIKILIGLGVNVNDKDQYGRLPLHWACQENALMAAKTLIRLGSYLRSQDLNGHSPLEIAVSEGNYQMVQLLLKAGAQKTTRALKLARSWGMSQIEELLSVKKS